MFDLWGFLLQTLSVSGVAALILIVKALFKDKLPPKWQFAVWGIFGIIMLIPAGIGGRYILFHWQAAVEIIKARCMDFSFTRVLFPIPIIKTIPHTVIEWIFAAYVLGVIVQLLKYIASYAKLRRIVHMGNELSGEKLNRIQITAAEKKVKLFKVVEVAELRSAFVCGIFRPVLVLPAGNEIDEKIILHELFHMKNKDTVWSVIICALRSLHWCNPVIAYCSGRALNDMESRCDQYVLENLEGEERREYGYILLSMSNERFAKTPGSTCINNGGKNIRERIENIARFKEYPQGMGLVSICVLILLFFPLAAGVQSSSLFKFSDSIGITLASARSIACTTPAGAFDTYGKAIIEKNGYYRAMCAPQSIQAEILNEMLEKKDKGIYPLWDSGVDEWVNKQEFYIYNLKHTDSNTYEGLLVVELNCTPDETAANGSTYLAVQKLRVENEDGRWVAIPLEAFRYAETVKDDLSFGCLELPYTTYSGVVNDMQIEVTYQTAHTIDPTATVQNGTGTILDFFPYTMPIPDTTPNPDAEFSKAGAAQSRKCIYIGSEADKASVTHIGLSSIPVYAGEKPPENLHVSNGEDISGFSSEGEAWSSKELEPNWDSVVLMDGGGGSVEPTKDMEYPEYFVAELYLNHNKIANLKLTEQKGEAS